MNFCGALSVVVGSAKAYAATESLRVRESLRYVGGAFLQSTEADHPLIVNRAEVGVAGMNQ